MLEILYPLPDGNLGHIAFDAGLEDEPSYEADITEHPVERGVNTTDHYRPKPLLLTVRGFITNTPHKVPGSHMFGVTGDFRDIEIETTYRVLEQTAEEEEPAEFEEYTRILKANVLTFSGTFDRVRAITDELERLREEAAVVEVVTGLKTYPNMMIKTYSVPRSSEFGAKAVAVPMVFQQIKVAEARTVEVAPPRPAQPRGHDEESKGNQPTKEEPQSESFLRRLLRG